MEREEYLIHKRFNKKYREKVNQKANQILQKPSSFDGYKRIDDLERKLKKTNDMIKATAIRDEIDTIHKAFLNAMFIIVAPNIKKDIISHLNELYKPFGLYTDFFPIRFDNSTKTWRYTGLTLPVTVFEGFTPNNRSVSKKKSNHGIKVKASQ